MTSLRLGNNVVPPMPIAISLEKLAGEQIKAVAPAGVPFDIYPLSIRQMAASPEVISHSASR